MKTKHLKIILTGGGSGGPVSPVLAVAQEIKKLNHDARFLFIGTRTGPERDMVEDIQINFKWVAAARWRRFFTIRNIVAPFVFLTGLIQSFLIMRKFRPDIVFSAGGFVAVPVCWAARFYRAQIVIHQQDARIGLANKLIAPIAHKITAAFEGTAKNFYSGSGLFSNRLQARAIWVGNPVRSDLFTADTNIKTSFKLHNQLPLLAVFTGATGAVQINKIVENALPELVKSYQIIHQTGRGKNNSKFRDENYHPIELLKFEEYATVLKKADFVVARAGLSTIAELSALKKVAIIIPMPDTHQEDNAKILRFTGAAAVLMGTDANSELLVQILNKLKYDQKLMESLAANMGLIMPPKAAEKIAKIILQHE